MTHKPNLLGGKIAVVDRVEELKQKQHENLIKALESENNARDVYVDLGKAEVEYKRAITALINNALGEPDAFKALLAIKAMSPAADAQVDSVMNEMIKNKSELEKAQIAKAWADTDKANQEARKLRIQADLEEHDVKKEIREDVDSE